MDFSNMIRPALHRITSSFASTNSSFIDRVLSFTGSFNDRISLLHHDAELGRPSPTEEVGVAHPLPQAPEAAHAAPVTTTAAGHPFDIEAGTTPPPLPPTAAGTAPEGPARQDETEPATGQDAESRRVGKSVQTVCLFAASASLVLFANLPSNKQQPGPGLYNADMAFIALGFFSSLGLSMFSIVARPGEAWAVARVQKWGMVVAVASVVVAFALRVSMTPAA